MVMGLFDFFGKLPFFGKAFFVLVFCGVVFLVFPFVSSYPVLLFFALLGVGSFLAVKYFVGGKDWSIFRDKVDLLSLDEMMYVINSSSSPVKDWEGHYLDRFVSLGSFLRMPVVNPQIFLISAKDRKYSKDVTLFFYVKDKGFGMLSQEFDDVKMYLRSFRDAGIVPDKSQEVRLTDKGIMVSGPNELDTNELVSSFLNKRR